MGSAAGWWRCGGRWRGGICSSRPTTSARERLAVRGRYDVSCRSRRRPVGSKFGFARAAGGVGVVEREHPAVAERSRSARAGRCAAIPAPSQATARPLREGCAGLRELVLAQHPCEHLFHSLAGAVGGVGAGVRGARRRAPPSAARAGCPRPTAVRATYRRAVCRELHPSSWRRRPATHCAARVRATGCRLRGGIERPHLASGVRSSSRTSFLVEVDTSAPRNAGPRDPTALVLPERGAPSASTACSRLANTPARQPDRETLHRTRGAKLARRNINVASGEQTVCEGERPVVGGATPGQCGPRRLVIAVVGLG